MSTLSRAFVLALFVILILGGVVFGIASRRVNHVYDIAPPPIARATAPDEVARGGRLFRTMCLDCHGGPGGTRAQGARVASAPEFIGEVWAPNITSDPQAGVGGWSDGDLARLMRNGLGRDGRYAATMPRFPRVVDEDVAAIIGFMRSDDPLVAPVATQTPRSRLGVGGTLALAYAAGLDVSGAPRLPSPPRGPNAAYGRYLASTIYGCVDCHTNGFGPTEEKLGSSGLLAGGLPLHDAKGTITYSRNLTPDAETGLGAWTAAELSRALLTGQSRDGRTLHAPMPVFRWMDEGDAQALFAFLHGLPAVRSPTPAPAPAPRG
jgi:mono/diheme cytochrome c family protein